MWRSMPARRGARSTEIEEGSRRFNAAEIARPPGPAARGLPSPWPGSFHGGLPWKARLPYPFPATTTLSEDFGCFRLLPRSSCYRGIHVYMYTKYQLLHGLLHAAA